MGDRLVTVQIGYIMVSYPTMEDAPVIMVQVVTLGRIGTPLVVPHLLAMVEEEEPVGNLALVTLGVRVEELAVRLLDM